MIRRHPAPARNDFHTSLLWLRSLEIAVGHTPALMLSELELVDLFARYRYRTNPDGSIRESSHHERTTLARREPTVTPAQIEALRKLHLDDTRYVEPIVRKTLLRDGLVTSPDGHPGPQPGHRRGRRPKQRLPLTDAGRAAIGVVDVEAKAS